MDSPISSFMEWFNLCTFLQLFLPFGFLPFNIWVQSQFQLISSCVLSLSLSFLLWSFRTKKREKKKEVFQPFGPLSRVSEQLKDFLQKKHIMCTQFLKDSYIPTHSLSLPDLFNLKKFSLEQSASNYCTLCDCCGCRNSCFCINQTKLQYWWVEIEYFHCNTHLQKQKQKQKKTIHTCTYMSLKTYNCCERKRRRRKTLLAFCCNLPFLNFWIDRILFFFY